MPGDHSGLSQNEIKEIEVFLAFAKHHPAGLDVNTVRKVQPPKPDIECDRKDGTGTVAFEMVEIVDEGLYKDMASKGRLEEQFHRTYESLPVEVKEESWSRYEDTALLVRFKKVPFHRANQIVGPLLSHLADSPLLRHTSIPLAPKAVRAVVEEIIPFNIGFPGPRFFVDATEWVRDPLIDRLREKMEERSYRTPWPMELVAFYHRYIGPPDVSWLAPAVDYVRGKVNAAGFCAVWIYLHGTDRLLAQIP
jgi:hypothetical protein